MFGTYVLGTLIRELDVMLFMLWIKIHKSGVRN